MSIEATLSELEIAGDLVRFTPRKGLASKRGLFMTVPLDTALSHPNSTVAHYKARKHILRLFERWVTGELMTISMNGGGTGAFIAQLDPPPPDIWELRVTEPRPQFRVFCRFIAKDLIVATCVRTRDELGPRSVRSKKRSKAWTDAMYDCKTQWDKILPGTTPIAGHLSTDFVTECEHA